VRIRAEVCGSSEAPIPYTLVRHLGSAHFRTDPHGFVLTPDKVIFVGTMYFIALDKFYFIGNMKNTTSRNYFLSGQGNEKFVEKPCFCIRIDKKV